MSKIAVITGAYGAIGKGIAEGMARHGYDLIMVGRNENALVVFVEELQKMYSKNRISYQVVDLSSENEIRDFAMSLKENIHVLINNAATCPVVRTETSDGTEIQFATNVLGYFRMILYLYQKINSGGRIVNVASYWAGGLDLNDIEFRTRSYDNDSAYRQSKQANRMLSSFFAEKLKAFSITVNACHPGDVNSKLSNDLGFGGHETPEQGAATPVWLAVSKDVEGISGKYFEHQRQVNCRFSEDREAVQRLYNLCLEYCAH